MKMTLTLDIEQLGILLAQIESMFTTSSGRDVESLGEEIEFAAKDWKPGCPDNNFDFSIIKIAPVYRQLLDIWLANAQGREDWGARDIIEAENLADMILALRAARAAVRDIGDTEVSRG